MSFPYRLRMVIKQSGLKRDQFAYKSKKSRNQIFKYLKGGSLPTADFFQAVKSEFPWVNIEWLVTGVGDMYSSALVESSLQEINGGQNIQEENKIGSINKGRFSRSQLTWNENKLENIQKMLEILEEYVAPEIIREIEEKLKNTI